MIRLLKGLCLVVVLSLFTACGRFIQIEIVEKEEIETVNKDTVIQVDKITEFKQLFKQHKLDIFIPPHTRIDTLIVDKNKKTLDIFLSNEFSYIPLRFENVKNYYDYVKNYFIDEYKDYAVSIKSMGFKIEDLVPNFYRTVNSFDNNRVQDFNLKRTLPILQNIDKPFKITKGLYNRNISLWHSHGWYYSKDAGRWEWQRPRLFQTVEDLIPLAFVLPYIAPMLENAGATLFIPRERDWQTNEIVVDNNTSYDIKHKYYLETAKNKKNKWLDSETSGFALGTPPYEVNYNPFSHGTSRFVLSDTEWTASVKWTADIKESGEYAVYISYTASENNVNDALYKIKHAGGITNFIVNQKIGGTTWLYVGKFKFNKDENNYVELTNKSKESGLIVSADAVRFGGGMGVVLREGNTSGRPKFVEGAKYYLQYAGMPDTLIYNLNKGKNDYNDDYKSRTEYTNYLFGAPFGPFKNKNVKGLSIPIDLSMAFHTDAGITNNDTTVGSLSIYSMLSADSTITFPNGVSRLACRDLADIVQTEIVTDIRSDFDIAWNRRQLLEAQYTEAQRPNVPSLLLELLSHQNFLDMKFMLDPKFRFTVSRAIYKGMLKFLSVQNNLEYVVQPLPVQNFAVQFTENMDLKLSWKETIDKIEKTATPAGYVVYTRINDGGFDNGIYTTENSFVIKNLEKNKVYSFKITAVNDGGESFPSEILSACKSDSKKPVLVVNAFDRICAPTWVDGEKFSGFLSNLDAGVPDKIDFGFSGYQYDFNPKSEFISNDEPGHGASGADDETKVTAGNTFDFAYIHGNSFKNNGYSFVSCSDECVEDGTVNLKNYSFVDFIFGEEKETEYQKEYENKTKGVMFRTFTKPLQTLLNEYLISGGNIFVSGAYIGTDMFRVKTCDSLDMKFADGVLKYTIATGYASRSGNVEINKRFGSKLSKIKFNTELNDKIYAVESPDAINPVKDSETLFRYNDNLFSAGIGYKKEYGIIAMGFPFETIINANDRTEFMLNVLNYLKIPK
ncbi:MAG: xanthan lyase [bacterium]